MPNPSAIRIHDTLSGELRSLDLRDPGRVGIYACGPTVYGRIHVGNARPYVTFMLFKRLLEHEGLEVELVVNITDINDKIYDAARAAGRPSEELAHEMAEAYRLDTDRLELGRPDAEPLASETIVQIIDLVQSLVDSGHAYESGGDVYFAVRSFGEYGKLSNRRLEDIGAGDQGEPDDDTQLKRDPLDFALWKTHKEGEDTSWDSPWGRGRPGWHIECSAMAEEIFGLDFDIHGGGIDLVFPHHENEIAQTEAARGKRLARIWMHNGMIGFGEEKMAKSVGNVKLLHEALDEAGRDALIMYFVLGHYRGPLVFSKERLAADRQTVERIRNFVRLLHQTPEELLAGDTDPVVEGERETFFDQLRDDFNTAAATAHLFRLIAEGNRRLEAGKPFTGVKDALAEMLQVLGLENLMEVSDGVDDVARELAAERDKARAERDFDRSDELRDELIKRGYDVQDTPDGTILWPAGSEGG